MVKLDGKSPEEFGLLFLKDHYHPATPEIRNRTLTIPGMSGEWDFGSEWGSRPFNLPFAIIEYNKVELQRKLRAFVAFLLDSYGKPRPIQLSFDYEPDVYYSVKLNNKVEPQRLLSTAEFEISFIAHDPYAYAEASYKQPGVITGINYDEGNFYPTDPNEIYMDSEVYSFSDPISFTEPYEPNYYYENPSSFQWTYAKQYSGVHIHSNASSSFIVEIEGTVINPRILNQTTGKTLYLPTISNQKLKVDTGKFSVKINDKSQLNTVRGVEEFVLVSGDNSLLFEGGLPNAIVTYKWKHKFM